MSHFERPRSQLNPLDPAFVNISPTKLNLQPTGVSTSYIPPQPYPIQSSALRTLPMQNPEFGRGVVNLRPSIVAPMAPIPAHFQSRISSRPSIPVYKA